MLTRRSALGACKKTERVSQGFGRTPDSVDGKPYRIGLKGDISPYGTTAVHGTVNWAYD